MILNFRHQHLQTLLGSFPVAAALRYSRAVSLNVLSLRHQASLRKRPAPNSVVQMAILQPSDITGSLILRIQCDFKSHSDIGFAISQ